MKIRTHARFCIYLLLISFAGVLSSSVIAFATDVAKLKIGVVNINQVLDAYAKRKDLEKQFLSFKTEIEQQLRHKQAEIKSLRDEVQLLDMGSESRKKNEEALEKKLMYLQLEEKIAENKLSKKEKEFFEELYRDVCTEVDNLGKKGQFDLILKREDLDLKSADILELRLKIGIGTVLYYSDALDLTNKVIESLNGNYYKQIDEK